MSQVVNADSSHYPHLHTLDFEIKNEYKYLESRGKGFLGSRENMRKYREVVWHRRSQVYEELRFKLGSGCRKSQVVKLGVAELLSRDVINGRRYHHG